MMSTRIFVMVLFALSICILSPTTQAQDVPAHKVDSDGRHTLNLKDADLHALVATVSEITGRNFILAPSVAAKVTVVSAQPMRPNEIYDVFLSVLRVHGFAAVPSGSMIRIVPEAQALQDGGTRRAGGSASPDDLITRVVPIEHVAAADLLPVLRPLMPQGGELVAHGNSNALVISDRASNVERLERIVRRMDTVSDAEVEVIPLRHANAAEMARTLTMLADDKGAAAGGGGSRVFADTRTNSILLSGARNGRLKMRALIVHLDAPLDGGGDTQVIYLRNANATDLVPILQGVASALTGEAQAGNSDGATASATSTTIQAHEDTNALVISAAPAVFSSLARVVRQLDVRRAQVLIEAIVAEVADQTASEIGVQWQAPFKTRDGELRHSVIGGTNFGRGSGNNILDAAVNPMGVGGGLNIGYLTGGLTLPGMRTPILEIGALVTALRNDGNTNILSTPSIMTLDNHEAQIKVAQEVPFLTGQYTTGGMGGGSDNPISNPFQTIERKDVGLVLKVTPHINEGDSVRLAIHQEVSSLAPNVSGAVDLITNKRELTTQALVADNSILVLGGLIDTQVKDNVQKVPALGDIPLLGNLFRYRSSERQKRDLMIFLHPRILRDAASEASVSSEKYNYMRTRQLELRDERWPLTQGDKQPMLPDVHDFLAAPPARAPQR